MREMVEERRHEHISRDQSVSSREERKNKRKKKKRRKSKHKKKHSKKRKVCSNIQGCIWFFFSVSKAVN